MIIGDLNPKNILVTKKARVMFLDCDGFQLSMSDRIYRCGVGFPEYTPPELQGKLLRESDRIREHDSFGLAVVIFQLLFLGRHPFSGRFLGEGEMSLERAIREYRFAYGADAESRGMRPPLCALALEAVSASLNGLFRRSFLSTSPSDRPQPGEWGDPLEWLTRCLKRCSLHTGHQYYDESPACPWCEIESRALVRLFNFSSDRIDQTRAHFNLQEVWIAIESVSPPAPAELPRSNDLPKKSKPREGTFEYKVQEASLGIVSVFFAVIIGFTIPWVTSIYFSIPLFFVAAYLAIKLVDMDLTEIKSEQRRISLRAGQAAEAAQDLEVKWRNEASEQRFIQMLERLQSQKQTYENLSQIRTARLGKLMAAGRDDQFNRFLDQRSVRRAAVPAQGPGVVADLASNGIISAADVSEEKLDWVPKLGKTGIEHLIQWRRETEQDFVFNPGDDALSRARIKAEQEIDRLRIRIEDELARGVGQLNRVKQEIEESRRNLRPAVISACRALAQARQDSETSRTVDEDYLRSRAIVLLFAAFLTASVLEKIDRDVRSERTRGCVYKGYSNPNSRPVDESKPVHQAPSSGGILSIMNTNMNAGNPQASSLVKNDSFLQADLLGKILLEPPLKEFYDKQYYNLGLDRFLRNLTYKNTKPRKRLQADRMISPRRTDSRRTDLRRMFIVSPRQADHSRTGKYGYSSSAADQ